VGDGGVRLAGVLWLLAAAAFVVAATGVAIDATWAQRATTITVLASLVLRVVGWPEARIGLFVNAAALRSATRVNQRVRAVVCAFEKADFHECIEGRVARESIQAPQTLDLWFREMESRDLLELTTDDLKPVRNSCLNVVHLLLLRRLAQRHATRVPLNIDILPSVSSDAHAAAVAPSPRL